MDKFSINVVTLAGVLLLGVALNRFSKFLKMPLLICFLAIGVIYGQHGLGVFPDLNMAQVQNFGELALSFIIFAGGLQTSFQAVKKVFVTGTILATVGVILTCLLTAVCCYYI